MIRLSSFYVSRRNLRKRRGSVPLAESKQCPYGMKYPELVDIAFNQIWGELNGIK